MAAIDLPRPAFMRTEELEMFAQSIEKFLTKHAAPEELQRWRNDGFVSRSVWEEAGDAGLVGIGVPAQFGGQGADFRFEVVLMEQLAFKNALNFALPLHNAVVVPYLISYGTDEQKKRWLPQAITGREISAIAMSEPTAGSDLRRMRTTAVREANCYVINGQKTFISNGLQASIIIVAAQTESAGASKGISLFVVETEKAAGFTRGRLLKKLGQEGRDTTEIFFSDVRVPAENLLGEEGQGFAMLMEKLPQERMVIAWQAMAMMEAALELTVAYTKERRAFGKALLDFQNTQFKLAEAKTLATAAKAFLYQCTQLLLEQRLDAATASMAKLWLTETQGKIIDECLQLFGGYGYMSEYPIAEMYKDARAFRIYGGTSEIMKTIIARTL